MDIKQLDALNAYGQAGSGLAGGLSARGDGAAGAGSSFAELIKDTVGDVRQAGETMEATSAKALVNEADLVEVVTAASNAEMVVETVVAVRDRVISAYNEIIKMPI